MRIPGRRHWTETFDLYAVTRVTSGPDTGKETRTLTQAGITGSIQPLTDTEKLELGITTSEAAYWARWATPTPRVGDEIIWRGVNHLIYTVREGNDIDIEALIRRHPAP